MGRAAPPSPRAPSTLAFICLVSSETSRRRFATDVVTRASRDAEMGGGEMTADELLAKAEKKMTTTLTRWKPDYESAMLYFDEAGA